MNWVVIDANGQTVSSGMTTKAEAEKAKETLQESTGQQGLRVVQVLLG